MFCDFAACNSFHFFSTFTIKCFTYVSPHLKNVSPNIMNRISIGFFLKLKAKDIKHPIYLRMIYQRKKTEYFIGYRCLTNEWDELKEEHVYDIHINRSIAKIKDKIYDTFHQLNLEGNEFDVTDIKDIALGKKTKKVKLNSFFDLFIEEYKNLEKVTPYTIKKYEQTLTRILGFQEQKNKQLTAWYR